VSNVTQWHGCYDDSWNGVLVPDAFAHPAKFAPGLISRILRHMLERGYIAPGDSIVDPFGGIAAGGYWAMLLGLHWTGIELEPRFVELGQRNIAKWQHDLRGLGSRLGTARLLQGDSRRLVEVVGAGMAGVVSSPPYAETHVADREAAQLAAAGNARAIPDGADNGGIRYGSTPGQLGSMPSGDYAAAVSSPPFSGDKNLMAVNDQGVRSDMVARRGIVESDTQQSPGNLATLRADDAGFSAAVSSPPHADAVNGSGEGPGARYDTVYHNGDNAYKQSSANGYGDAPGQLGRMAGEGFEAAVSSPPYQTGGHHDHQMDAWNTNGGGQYIHGERGYAQESEAQLGGDGDTFWTAARAIVEQTYAALRPGGYAAWVTKDFVRKGQRVPFSDQWQQLCAAVGFEPVERIAAMLVDDHGSQLDIFGGATPRRTERKSFFRRLAEKKGSPRIDWEDVIIMRKPNRTAPNANGARSEP